MVVGGGFCGAGVGVGLMVVGFAVPAWVWFDGGGFSGAGVNVGLMVVGFAVPTWVWFDGGGFCGAGLGVVEIVGKKEKK